MEPGGHGGRGLRPAAAAEPAAGAQHERAGSRVRVVAFALDGDRYGLPLDAVERVLPMVAVSPLPGAPEAVLGAINVHGVVVPVLDIRRRLGLPAGDLGPSARLLVARAGLRTVALPADDIAGVVDVREDSIVPPESVLSGIEHVAGVAVLVDGLLLIHDPETFFSLDEERQLAEALGEERV
jgi:purine-binding chemotaxis protein CheW